jgi:hypothetical protein
MISVDNIKQREIICRLMVRMSEELVHWSQCGDGRVSAEMEESVRRMEMGVYVEMEESVWKWRSHCGDGGVSAKMEVGVYVEMEESVRRWMSQCGDG